MYRLARGGRKEDLAERLLTSGYPLADILIRAKEVKFGEHASEYLSKRDIQARLQEAELPVSGSNRTLILRLVENRLFDGKALLETLPIRRLNDLYYSIFHRVPTVPRQQAVREILSSSGLDLEEPGTERGKGVSTPLQFEHDVALSFAGEDRAVAREIGERLRQAGVRVFLDEFYKPELWGKHLSDEFRLRYGPKSCYVVPLISRHYAVKDWTDFEFTIARREASRRAEEFILPVRLDDTVLVGLRSDVAYLDFRKEGTIGVVNAILAKLDTRRVRGVFVASYGINVPEALKSGSIRRTVGESDVALYARLEKTLLAGLARIGVGKVVQPEASQRTGETISVRVALMWDYERDGDSGRLAEIGPWDLLAFEPAIDVYGESVEELERRF